MSRSPSADDVRDLAGFGYRQRLDRSLGGFSAFAAGFSYLSVLTGSSQLFHLGFAAGGPAFFWTWPVVCCGQFLVALCFAEMASRYPLSGGVYQWSKRVGSETLGRMAGWVYLTGSVITLASVALALQATLPHISPRFQLVGSASNPGDAARNAVLLGSGLIVFSTVINAFGVRLLARVNNVGVFVEMVGATLLIGLLAWAAKRGPAVVFDTQNRGAGLSLGYLGPALAASIMASFVLYGFDTAGSLAEETDDPRKRAPKAILLALASVGVAGSLLVFVALRAVGNPHAPELSLGSGGLAYVVEDALGSALGTPFLCVVVFSIVVCTLTVHAAAVRLTFAMARDNNLPFADDLARVSDGSKTPTLPAVVIGLAASALLIVNIDFPKVIEVTTSLAVVWANLAYLLVTGPMLYARLTRRTPEPGPFDLGRWGLAVNVAAVFWGVALVINVGWPRPEIYGEAAPGRYSAAIATAAMLAVGWLYDRLTRRRKLGAGAGADVVAEHRAIPSTSAESLGHAAP